MRKDYGKTGVKPCKIFWTVDVFGIFGTQPTCEKANERPSGQLYDRRRRRHVRRQIHFRCGKRMEYLRKVHKCSPSGRQSQDLKKIFMTFLENMHLVENTNKNSVFSQFNVWKFTKWCRGFSGAQKATARRPKMAEPACTAMASLESMEVAVFVLAKRPKWST